MMKSFIKGIAVMGILVLVSFSTAQAQKYECTPVNLDQIWNAVIWYHDGQQVDPNLGLDTHGGGIQISTLPKTVIPGQVNITEDGEVAFLLPDMEIGKLNAYYVAGDTVPVPPGKYEYVFIAATSDNGNWPGSESDWAPIVDPATGKVTDPRSEGNSFKPIYEDGSGDWISIGVVQDWFWKIPEWVTPASGNASEVVQQYLSYNGDVNGNSYFLDGVGHAFHGFGEYTYCNGVDNFFIYFMDIPAGLKQATLWTEMWGNVKFSITTGDPYDAAGYKEMYNSAKADQVYTPPAGNLDGYFPNRDLRDFDLSPFLTSGKVDTIFLKFEDAAPENAVGQANNPWGPRVRQLGIFTGPVVKSSSGARLWRGMSSTSWGAPQDGLTLVRKTYRIDEKRTLKSLLLPNNFPQNDPYLILFGITLGNKKTAIKGFDLY